MLEAFAFACFVIAAILSCSTHHARWWPAFACAGLALATWPHIHV